MSAFLSRPRVRDALLALALSLCMAALLLFPAESVEAARAGLELCGSIIIPSLFPFFVLATMITELGLASRLGRAMEGIMRPLFNVPGSCSTALALGFVGGYPVGARTAIELYKNGCCTKSEAERLLSFCNNSGPAFILGVVGVGVFGSSAAGLLLYMTHIVSSLIVGLLFRFHRSRLEGATPRRVTRQSAKPVSFPAAFTGSVASAFSSTLNICGFVVFFTVFIRMLFAAGVIPALSGLVGQVLSPLGFDRLWAERLLTGVIEISSGVWSLQDAAGALPGVMSMAAFILGWAGLSVHCQVLSFIGGSGLSTRSYILGKALHGVISAALTAALTRVLPFDAEVILARQVAYLSQLRFQSALRASVAAAFVLWLVVLVVSVACIKSYGNPRSHDV